MSIQFPFENSYARLPERFYASQKPTPVANPALVAINETLALELGLDPVALASPLGVAMLAGNAVPDGAEPLAQAYAGHQFGGWSPQLGDGRAVLLGEVLDQGGTRRDIQLKGSGRTPFSRNGDGRAWLGPVLREYVLSEAMHALGVPTTRALAAVTTGERVQRESALPGAVLTRVAASHIRVGTFQYFAARKDVEALQILADHVIARHYPEVETPLELLEAVIARQAALVAKWMGVGFIHGVMNTDNMAISGETIDYGPAAYMDVYEPGKVYSSIDRQGRYAYMRQPDMAAWNLAQFASSLLPLMGEIEPAIEVATAAIHKFPEIYGAEHLKVFGRKLGLSRIEDGDDALIQGFLKGLVDGGVDFTNGFRGLADGDVPDGLEEWAVGWRARLTQETGDTVAMMRGANPAFIPRNHRIEAMIKAAVSGDYAPFEKLNEVLARPFEDQPENVAFRAPPEADEVVAATFCGT
ncbi:MAG: protein adenylyltransferase SelO [Paracoccaceae bacterium]